MVWKIYDLPIIAQVNKVLSNNNSVIKMAAECVLNLLRSVESDCLIRLCCAFVVEVCCHGVTSEVFSLRKPSGKTYSISLCCFIRNSLGYSESHGNLDQIADVVNVVILLACLVGRSMRHRLCNCRFCTLNGKRKVT